MWGVRGRLPGRLGVPNTGSPGVPAPVSNPTPNSGASDRLRKGLIDCGVITLVVGTLIVAALYGSPPADAVEVGIALDAAGVTIPTLGLGLIVGFYPGYGDLLDAGRHVIEDFGGGCINAIVG